MTHVISQEDREMVQKGIFLCPGDGNNGFPSGSQYSRKQNEPGRVHFRVCQRFPAAVRETRKDEEPCSSHLASSSMCCSCCWWRRWCSASRGLHARGHMPEDTPFWRWIRRALLERVMCRFCSVPVSSSVLQGSMSFRVLTECPVESRSTVLEIDVFLQPGLK